MLLSVIIPYYNRNAWIGRTLDSLLDQGLDPSDYEIIVVDDDSPQKAVTMREYVRRYPNIHYHRVAHGGQGVGRNIGLSLAKGEWIFFCDSDDFLQPRVLGGMIKAAQERDLEMIIGHYVVINPGEPIPANPRRNFSAVTETMTGWEYFGNPPDVFSWGPCAYVFKRSVAESNGLQFEDINYVEDRLFKLDLLKVVTRAACIDVDHYYYVQNQDSVYHDKRWSNGPAYIDTLFYYLERLTRFIEDPETPPIAVKMFRYRRQRGSYILLLNAFVYCPSAVLKSSIDRLKTQGLYPVRFELDKGSLQLRTIKRLMDHPRLWLFLHRVFHLLPESFIRQRVKINR